jgi:hypothetical protein
MTTRGKREEKRRDGARRHAVSGVNQAPAYDT